MTFIKRTAIGVGIVLAVFFFIGLAAGIADPDRCFNMDSRKEKVEKQLQATSAYRLASERDKRSMVLTLLEMHAAAGEFSGKCLRPLRIAAMPTPTPPPAIQDVTHLYRQQKQR